MIVYNSDSFAPDEFFVGVDNIGRFDLPAPTFSAFAPASGHSGTTVTLTGTNFTGATAVRFGTRDASSFAVDSSAQITNHPPGGLSPA